MKVSKAWEKWNDFKNAASLFFFSIHLCDTAAKYTCLKLENVPTDENWSVDTKTYRYSKFYRENVSDRFRFDIHEKEKKK